MVNYYPYPCSVLQFPSDSIKLLTILTRLHLSSSPWVDLTICWICITLSELNIHNKHLLFQINTIVLWLTAYERGGVKSVIKSRKSCPMWLRLSCLALTPQIVRGSVHTKSTICDASTFHAMHDLLWVFFAGKVSKFASFHSFIRNGNYYIDTHSLANNNFNAYRNESDKWDVCVRVSCSIRSSWFAPIYYYVIAGIFTTQQCFEICSILSVALTIQCVGIV